MLTEYTRCVLLPKDMDHGLPEYVVAPSSSRPRGAEDSTVVDKEDPPPAYEFIEESSKNLVENSRPELPQYKPANAAHQTGPSSHIVGSRSSSGAIASSTNGAGDIGGMGGNGDGAGGGC